MDPVKLDDILNQEGLKIITKNDETLIYLEKPTTTEVYRIELKEIILKEI